MGLSRGSSRESSPRRSRSRRKKARSRSHTPSPHEQDKRKKQSDPSASSGERESAAGPDRVEDSSFLSHSHDPNHPQRDPKQVHGQGTTTGNSHASSLLPKSAPSSSLNKNAFTEWHDKIERIVNDPTDTQSNRFRRAHDKERQIFVGSLPRHITEEEIRAVFSSFGDITRVFLPKTGMGFVFLEYATADAAEMAVEAMQGFVLKGKMIYVSAACQPPLGKSRPTQQHGQSSSSSASSSRGGREEREESSTAGQRRNHKDEPDTRPSTAQKSPRPPSPSAPSQPVGDNRNSPKRVILPKRRPPSMTGLFGISPYQQFASRAQSEDLCNQVEGSRVVKASNFPPEFVEADIKQVFDVFGAVMRIDFDPHRRQAFIHFFDKAHANTAVSTMHGFDVGGSRLHVTLDAKNGAEPSSVIVLRNLMAVDELDADVKNEIYQECKKHGKVLEVRVHVVEKTKEVRAFALYQLPEQANRAVRVLRERRFAKRKVECELYDMPSYNKHKYDL